MKALPQIHRRAAGFALMLGMCVQGSAAMAQDRLAFVLGTTMVQGQRLTAVRDDTQAVSRTLLGAGFDVVRREDVQPGDVDLFRRPAGLMVLYFSGQVEQDGDEIWLLGPNGTRNWPLMATLRKLRITGVGQVVAIVETCHSGADTPVVGLSDEGATLPAGVFLALAAGSDAACAGGGADARLTDRLLAALTAEDREALTLLSAPVGEIRDTNAEAEVRAAGLVLNTLPEQRSLFRVQAAARPVAGAASRVAASGPVVIDQSAGTGVAGGDVISPISPVMAVSPVVPVSPVTAPVARTAAQARGSQTAIGQPNGGDATVVLASAQPGVRIVDVSPSALLAAIPTPSGLPRPSIIVGDLRSAAEQTPTEEGAALAGTGLDASGYEAREQIRASDPELYTRLVADGAFDPTADAMAAALQTTLQRMGCYRGAIDGDWGNGSRASVDRYFAQAGGAAPTREATVDLFRVIILREDVVCPAPQQVAAPTARATTRTQAAAPTPTVRRTQATAAPAAPATRTRTINQATFGSGGLR